MVRITFLKDSLASSYKKFTAESLEQRRKRQCHEVQVEAEVDSNKAVVTETEKIM